MVYRKQWRRVRLLFCWWCSHRPPSIFVRQSIVKIPSSIDWLINKNLEQCADLAHINSPRQSVVHQAFLIVRTTRMRNLESSDILHNKHAPSSKTITHRWPCRDAVGAFLETTNHWTEWTTEWSKPVHIVRSLTHSPKRSFVQNGSNTSLLAMLPLHVDALLETTSTWLLVFRYTWMHSSTSPGSSQSNTLLRGWLLLFHIDSMWE